MRFLAKKQSNDLSQSFTSLLQIIREDKEINTRVVQLLKLDPFKRRLLLNKWLEQLRRNNAPQKLMQSLVCLFDDSIAERVLILIRYSKIKNALK